MDKLIRMDGLTLELKALDCSRESGRVQHGVGHGHLIAAKQAVEQRLLVADVAWAGAVFVELLARLPWIERLVVELQHARAGAGARDAACTMRVVEVRASAAPVDLSDMIEHVETVLGADMGIEAVDLAPSLLTGASPARVEVDRSRVAHLFDARRPVGLEAAMALWPTAAAVRIVSDWLAPAPAVLAGGAARR